MSTHQIYPISHAGRRRSNEDRILDWHQMWKGVPVTLLAVADGMGGHACGEVASDLAIRTLKDRWESFLKRDNTADPQALRAFVLETYAAINESIRKYAQAHKEAEGMGTTLVTVFVLGRHALIANVGDSRAYRIKRDLIEQLTDDHSAMAESLREGLITELEVKHNPYQHALTRSLDGEPKVEADLFPSAQGWIELSGNDILFVCSDGLTGWVTELELYQGFVRTGDIRAACQHLVVQAYQQGSNDNISLVALEVGRVPRLATQLRDVSARPLPPPATPRARKHASRMPLVLLVLLGLVLLGLVGLFVRQVRRAGPAPASLTTIARETVQLPFTDTDRLAWRLNGAAADHYRFEVTFARAASDGVHSPPLFRKAVQDTVVYLKVLSESHPDLAIPGRIQWQVSAFGVRDTLRSRPADLVIQAIPEPSEPSHSN